MAYRYLGNKTRIAEWIADVVSDTLNKAARIADPNGIIAPGKSGIDI
jgi:hypothetical protein